MTFSTEDITSARADFKMLDMLPDEVRKDILIMRKNTSTEYRPAENGEGL